MFLQEKKMKLTTSQQIAEDIFKSKNKKKLHNGTSLDEQLLSSAKKSLLKKIDFVDAQKPFSMNLNKLKNKYILLNPQHENSSQKRFVNDKKLSKDKAGAVSDGIPAVKYNLFSAENVDCNWKKSMRVGAGLENLGNTCFLNSALQCLTYTPPLANYMLYANHKNHCKLNGQFCMLCALQHHISNTLNSGGRSVRPISILKNLRSIAKHMHFGRQEDAHEFIRYSVDAMQKSCLHGHSNKLDMHSKATTLVHRIFGGYLRSRVKCRQCKAVSDTFDPFLDISLNINKQGCSDLRRCLEHFVSPEILQGDNCYKCQSCKNNVSASKTFSIHRPPNVLNVQLKRFSSFMGNKINKDVTYPSKLNLGLYMSSSHKNGPWYQLYAVLVHSGYSCQSGHYYAYAKAANGQWYCLNDSSVYQVSANQALSQQAYLLFYHKVAESGKLQTEGSRQLVSSVKPQEPILHHLNKETKQKCSSTNGLNMTSINPQREKYVKIFSDNKCYGNLSSEKESTKPSHKTENSILSKCGSVSSASRTNQLVKRKPIHADSSKSLSNKSLGFITTSVTAKSVVTSAQTVMPELSKEIHSISNESSSLSTNNKDDSVAGGTSASPSQNNEVILSECIRRKRRESQNSSDSSSSKKNQKLTKSLISFQLKPFSNLPQHQKHWRKIQQPRDQSSSAKMVNGKRKTTRDDNSSSSSDSCRLEKERAIYAKKLKLLSKHKLSYEDNNGNKEESYVPLKKYKADSESSQVPHNKSNSSNHTSKTSTHLPVTVKKWDEETSRNVHEKSNVRHNVLSQLLEQSTSKAYGVIVPSWSGEESVVEKDARNGYNNHRYKTDDWDQEYDRGRTKKVKTKHKNNVSKTNLFQKFQKYHKTVNSY